MAEASGGRSLSASSGCSGGSGGGVRDRSSYRPRKRKRGAERGDGELDASSLTGLARGSGLRPQTDGRFLSRLGPER